MPHKSTKHTCVLFCPALAAGNLRRERERRNKNFKREREMRKKREELGSSRGREIAAKKSFRFIFTR